MEGKHLRVLVSVFRRIFTKLLKIPIAVLRRIQIRIIIYLDDMLLMSQTVNSLVIPRNTLIFLLQSLGFVINLQRSILVPLQKIEFLGLEIDSVRMTLTLPQEKVKKLRLKCQKLISNPRTTKEEDDSHFQRDLGIRIVQGDYDSCKVPAGHIERQNRLGFQKFPRLKRMATISKSISKKLCKVGIPRVGSFYIRSMPSDTILPVLEKRSTQPSNRCIPTELETLGATVCFSPFFNDGKSSMKGQNRGGGCNSNNTKLVSTTLVQTGFGIICSRTSASTSVKQHLSKSSGPGTPSCREQNLKTSGLECFRQSLASEGISERAAELITGAKRPGTSFNTNQPGVNGLAGVVNRKLICIHAI